mmetsp:Transcript_15903/g.60588  ORF Transcript_15903/g.60588 Transcript_15903/m.60588 type:complete len:169 (-) Transcript_15903:396-902(-)
MKRTASSAGMCSRELRRPHVVRRLGGVSAGPAEAVQKPAIRQRGLARRRSVQHMSSKQAAQGSRPGGSLSPRHEPPSPTTTRSDSSSQPNSGTALNDLDSELALLDEAISRIDDSFITSILNAGSASNGGSGDSFAWAAGGDSSNARGLDASFAAAEGDDDGEWGWFV